MIGRNGYRMVDGQIERHAERINERKGYKWIDKYADK